MTALCLERKSQPKMMSWEEDGSTMNSMVYTMSGITTRAVQVASGFMCCASVVRKKSPESGVITFRIERQRSALTTETAAPVSISARVGTPSTSTSMTFSGDKAYPVGLRGGTVVSFRHRNSEFFFSQPQITLSSASSTNSKFVTHWNV